MSPIEAFDGKGEPPKSAYGSVSSAACRSRAETGARLPAIERDKRVVIRLSVLIAGAADQVSRVARRAGQTSRHRHRRHQQRDGGHRYGVAAVRLGHTLWSRRPTAKAPATPVPGRPHCLAPAASSATAPATIARQGHPRRSPPSAATAYASRRRGPPPTAPARSPQIANIQPNTRNENHLRQHLVQRQDAEQRQVQLDRAHLLFTRKSALRDRLTPDHEHKALRIGAYDIGDRIEWAPGSCAAGLSAPRDDRRRQYGVRRSLPRRGGVHQADPLADQLRGSASRRSVG